MRLFRVKYSGSILTEAGRDAGPHAQAPGGDAVAVRGGVAQVRLFRVYSQSSSLVSSSTASCITGRLPSCAARLGTCYVAKGAHTGMQQARAQLWRRCAVPQGRLL